MLSRTPTIAAVSVLAMVSLVGCSAANTGTTASNSSNAGITIVASTNVWGDVAATIAGDRATVTSFISNATQDPHSYEASARDQLAISRASLVIENGGGYDPFMDTLLNGSGNTSAIVINAAADADQATQQATGHDAATGHDSASGHDHGAGFNEHVWYSFEAVRAVAEDIAHELGTLDPANSADYTLNFESFSAQLDGLDAQAASLKTQFAGEGAAITEPIPLYLLEAVGLVNMTPEAFSTAFEEGTDVSPLVLLDMIAILNNGSVAVFAYNDQTTSAQGEQVRTAAKAAGIPVVAFTETLPQGRNYVSWMTENLTALSKALAS